MEWGLRAQPTNGAVNGWSCRISLKGDQHGGAVLRTRLWRGSDSPYLAEKARCLSVRRIVQCTRTLPGCKRSGFTNAPPHVAYQPCARSPGKRAPMLCGGGGSDDALSRCWERRILSWDAGADARCRLGVGGLLGRACTTT